jgi:hypothetical protein
VVLTLLAVSAFLLALSHPHEALAWGPGVHTASARFVLANLDLVAPAIAALIARFPKTFLYGCLSADFFVGKGTKIRPGHSHNWESAARLARAATSDQLTVHALGYMSHLAADVVAHNYYVPQVMARTALPGSLTHVYVEMQADSRLTGGHGIRGRLSMPAAQRMLDRNLASALEKSPFTTFCRKRVFRGGMELTGLRGWDRSLRFAQRVLPLPDDRASLDAMFELSLRAVLDVLASPEGTVLRQFDPIGSRNLSRAKLQMAESLDSRLIGLPKLPTPLYLDVA